MTYLFVFCDRHDGRPITTLRPLSHLALKCKGPSSMSCRDRGSYARGVYPTQDTSRMGTTIVKQEEEADTRILANE